MMCDDDHDDNDNNDDDGDDGLDSNGDSGWLFITLWCLVIKERNQHTRIHAYHHPYD